MIKRFAVYDEPFWRADGLNGEAISDRGPVKVTLDNSPPDGSPGVLLGFPRAVRPDSLPGRPKQKRRAAVLDNFRRFFGPRAADPVQYVERDWMRHAPGVRGRDRAGNLRRASITNPLDMSNARFLVEWHLQSNPFPSSCQYAPRTGAGADAIESSAAANFAFCTMSSSSFWWTRKVQPHDRNVRSSANCCRTTPLNVPGQLDCSQYVLTFGRPSSAA